ncbi:MAG: gliding motility-associated C-terminal domain-containing protein [Saprospiraceae bacterium]|nr:gliding motility-associated C-terminal domain-containing protein [Saprospiraceae bacterium]
MRPLFIPFIISCLAIFLPQILLAQDCDCEGSGNCPASIPINSTGEICFDVTDALNNDLANPNQGVCGVQITFMHQHIWDLELWLVSPGGDTVQLMGPNINVFGTTNSVLWDVIFVPCSVAPIPDTVNGNPLEEVWTNNQNWPFGGFISGSYLPYGGGCLESFNSGPANGSWCLLYENSPSTYSGEILNFEIILCDQTGILCCDAEAGSLSAYPDLELCEGHPGLTLDIPPDFILGEPDTLEYGYTYIISDQNGVILEYDSIPDLSDQVPGFYTVCGFSYRLDDTLNIPDPDGFFTVQDLRDYMLIDLNMLCGDINNNCIDITIVAPPAPVALLDTICAGDMYEIGDTTILDAGLYDLIFQTSAECDSVVNLNLTVIPLDTTQLMETICDDEIYQVGDSTFSVSGMHEVLLANQYGCDSLVLLDLLVLDPIQTDLVDTICIGEVFTVGNTDFSSSGNYQVLLQTPMGCDSLVTLDLTVLDLQVVIAQPDTITCISTFQILDGTGTSPGSLNWSTLDGNLAGPLDQITAFANAGGTYYLLVEQAACMALDSVTIITNNELPAVEAGLPDTLDCNTTSLQLDGTGSAVGPDFEYLWTSLPGNIVSGETELQPTVALPGMFFLLVTNTVTGCQALDSVQVVDNVVYPFVDAGPDGVLTCTEPIYTLDGSDSYNENFILDWDDSMGVDVTWFDSLQAPVSSPGWYYLTISDLSTGCVSTDSAEVTLDQILPFIQLVQPDTLTCMNQVVSLDASGSDSGPGLQTEWTTQEGSISGNPNNLQVNANAPGTYYFTITNISSGCVSMDSVEVAIDTLSPIAEAGVGAIINCVQTQFTMGDPAITSQGPEFIYQWLDSNGGFLGDQIQLTVQTGDTYVLNVININNGCTSSDTVFIEQEQVVPVADVGSAGPLTCDTPLDTLGGPNSSVGVFIEYAWYDADGQVVGTDTILPVGIPGNYCLVVSDGINLCADTACVEVLADASLPVADAGPDQALDCLTGQATMDGSNSSNNPNVVYTWSGGGTILTDPSLAQIEVSGLGTYYLQVEDQVNDCFTIDSVNTYIDTVACLPFAAAGLPGVINCTNFPYDTLDAGASESGPHITYLWTAISGMIIEGEDTVNPAVVAGTYELQVTNIVLNITSVDTVQVFEDLDSPIAEAGPGLFLDCSTLGNNFSLDGTGSSVGPEFIYNWTDINGIELIGGDGLMPTINEPGIYSIVVTDTINGCAASDAVLIGLDGDYPAPCLPTSYQIECGSISALVGDTCAVQHPDYLYEWTVSNGTILTDPQAALIEVDPDVPFAMVYLMVTDQTNSCTAVDSIQVFSPVACFPDCEVAAPPVLTCIQDTIYLDAGASSTGPEFEYEWTTLNGSLCGGETTLFPCVNAPGLYELTVTDITNQFSCSTSIQVQENLSQPSAEAGNNMLLTCTLETVLLDATASIPLPGDIIDWTGPAGNCILSGVDGLEPAVACAGWYFLTITSAITGCTATDSVLVSYDTLAPQVILAVPQPISCVNNPSVLNGSGSDQGPNFLYNWYLNGNLINTGINLTMQNGSEEGIYCLEIQNQSNGCLDSVCVELLADASLPSVDAGLDQVLSCNTTSLIIDGTASVGAQYNYLWTATNGGCILSDPALLSIEVACVGTYTLTVTDTQNGCTNASTMAVSAQLDPPFTDAGPDQELDCLVTEVSLDGSGSDQGATLIYTWTALSGNLSGPTNGMFAQADQPGLYQLSIEETLGGCIGYDTVEVTESLLLPIADAGPDQLLTCAVNQLQLDGFGSSQGDSLIYSWQAQNGGNILSGVNALDPLVNADGTYVLTVQDTLNGCFQTDTVLVGLDLMVPQAQIDSTELLQLDCNTQTLQLLGGSSMPFGELNFQWQTIGGQIVSNPGLPDIEVNGVGVYTLIVESIQNGCQDTAQVTVAGDFTEPQLLILTPEVLSCFQESVSLDATPSSTGTNYSYQWVAPAGSGAVILDSQTLTPTVFEPLNFTLTITDSENGCSVSGSINVEIDTMPPIAIATSLGAIDCDDPEIVLSGAGSSAGTQFMYDWSGPGILSDPTEMNIDANMPGWYFIQVSNSDNGCSAIDSTELLAFALPIYGAILEVDSASCFGREDGSMILDSVIGGSPPILSSLDGQPFENYTQFYYLAPGTHQLDLMDINGCEWSTTFTIGAGNDLMVDLGPDIDLQVGDATTIEVQLNIPIEQVDTLWWTPQPDPDCMNCLVLELSPVENIAYSVTVTDLKGCTASDQILIRVDTELDIYFPNAFHPNGDGYNDVFYPMAGLEVQQINWLRIYDRWGNKVFEANDFLPNDPAQGWDGTFEGQPLNPAVFVYVAEIFSGNGTKKVVKGDVLLIR